MIFLRILNKPSRIRFCAFNRWENRQILRFKNIMMTKSPNYHSLSPSPWVTTFLFKLLLNKKVSSVIIWKKVISKVLLQNEVLALIARLQVGLRSRNPQAPHFTLAIQMMKRKRKNRKSNLHQKTKKAYSPSLKITNNQ